MSRERIWMWRGWLVMTGWLLLIAVAAGYSGWRFHIGDPLQTNVLALLPTSADDPLEDRAVERLTGALGDRAVFLINDRDATQAEAAARLFADTLSSSHAFASVTAKVPPFDPTSIGRFYQPWQFRLLTHEDSARLATPGTSLRDLLNARMYSFMPAESLVPLGEDPFGWRSRWVAGLPLSNSNLMFEHGLLVSHGMDHTDVLVNATLNGSAYDSGVQQRVAASVTQATRLLVSRFPDVQVARTGTVFYAQAARSTAERESHRIGLMSLAGVAMLMLWVFRSGRVLFYSFVSTALGILCALAGTLWLFGQLNLLTLVFGASLIGEAVDYSIQYFIVRAGRTSGGDARRSAVAVRPALTLALITSLVGYLMMACVPMPVLQQLACFAMIGLLVACASVQSLLPVLSARGEFPSTGLAQRLKWRPWPLMDWLMGWRGALLALVFLLVAIPGWLQLRGNDDVHLLIQRPVNLVDDEARISAVTGFSGGSQFFLVRGASPEQVLTRSEAVTAGLATLPTQAGMGGWMAIDSFVSSLAKQHENGQLLAGHVFADPSRLRGLLSDAGFRDAPIDRWLAAWRTAGQQRGLTVDDWLAQPWSAPFRHLWMPAQTGQPMATLVVPHDVNSRNEALLSGLAARVPGVTLVDKALSVSHQLGVYRVRSTLWLCVTLVLVSGLFCGYYGWRTGMALSLPVLLSLGSVLAIFGYAHLPLNIFNCLALVLVLGVGANYAVFLHEGARRSATELATVWGGVLLSAATTLLSFGLLGLSSMPALQSFGLTLTLGIVIAVLFAPLGVLRQMEEQV